MRTYTFKRKCGHSTRGKQKTLALARPCLYCLLTEMQDMTAEQKVFVEKQFNQLDIAIIQQFRNKEESEP